MYEQQVNLNVNEIGILLSALQLLTMRDENQIAKEYGSASTLYDKLKEVYERMDSSETGLRNDVVPSY